MLDGFTAINHCGHDGRDCDYNRSQVFSEINRIAAVQ